MADGIGEFFEAVLKIPEKLQKCILIISHRNTVLPIGKMGRIVHISKSSIKQIW
jgi:hypothetical protein